MAEDQALQGRGAAAGRIAEDEGESDGGGGGHVPEEGEATIPSASERAKPVAGRGSVRADASTRRMTTLHPLPPEDHYLSEPGYHQVRNAKQFHDINISDAAAGFVSYKPITMLFRRWPFRIFAMVCATYFTAYTLAYALEFQEPGVEGADDILLLVIANVGVAGLLCWTAPVLAMCHWARAATIFFGAGIGWNGFLSMYVWVYQGLLEKDYLFALWSAIIAFAEINMAFTFAFKEDWVWYASMVDSLLVFAVAGILLPTFGMAAALNLLAAGLWITMWVSFMFWRQWSMRKAAIACKPDQARYDEIWEPVKQKQATDLRRLAEVVNAWRHQRITQPFLSLDVIYQRGYALNEWYQEVVESWAEACGARALRAPVKSLHRTLEKVHRSYRGRIPPVIDIVRSSIVVDKISTARKVLVHVLSHSTVHQIKNRFDLYYTGEQTCGYRDLNLHLTFKELMGTPFMGFVFELQIHHQAVLAVKSDQGHQRYIRLRNLRGD